MEVPILDKRRFTVIFLEKRLRNNFVQHTLYEVIRRDLSPEEIKDYASEDADITFQLKKLFEKEIEKDHLKDLFWNMEMPLLYVLSDMEKEGIAIDAKGLAEYSKELAVSLERLET